MMNESRVLFYYDSEDAAWAVALSDRLQAQINRRVRADNRPVVERMPRLAQLPDSGAVGPLSPVVLVLPAPNRRYSPEESERISTFLDWVRRGGPPLLLISPEPERDRATGLFDGFHPSRIHDLDHAAAIRSLTAIVLRLAGLHQIVRDKSVFLSYRMSDGRPWAERLEQGLLARGYDVLRDGEGDAPVLPPGEGVQRSVLQAVQQCGILVLVDTPESSDSRWIGEEIDTALSSQIPILAVVIEDGVSATNPRRVSVPGPGGRFPQLRALGVEYRLTISQQALAARAGTRFDAIDEETFLRIETLIGSLIEDQKRLRLKLVEAARSRLERANFSWSVVDTDRALYEADLPLESDYSPGLRLRLLVQCLPYDEDLARLIAGLDSQLCEDPGRYQYGLLIAMSGGYPEEKRRLLGARGRPILLLSPDELNHLLSTFRPRLLPREGGL